MTFNQTIHCMSTIHCILATLYQTSK